MEVRVRMCPRDEDIVLCRSSGQVQNCVGEAKQQESLPGSVLWRARPGPRFLLPPQNDLGFPWVGGVLLSGPLGILQVSVVCLLRSGVMDQGIIPTALTAVGVVRITQGPFHQRASKSCFHSLTHTWSPSINP